MTGSLDPNNANDVFLNTFTLASTGDVGFQSYCYNNGGFDGYPSVFTGGGPSATFLTSNDDGCIGCADRR